MRKISFLSPQISLYISNFGNSSPWKNQLETFCLASVPGPVFRCLSQLVKQQHLAHCLHSLSEQHHPGFSERSDFFQSASQHVTQRRARRDPGDPARDSEKWEDLPRVAHVSEGQNLLPARKKTSGNMAPRLSL